MSKSPLKIENPIPSSSIVPVEENPKPNSDLEHHLKTPLGSTRNPTSAVGLTPYLPPWLQFASLTHPAGNPEVALPDTDGSYARIPDLNP
jgi:hypothetical protein